jgi:UPF0755 protein
MKTKLKWTIYIVSTVVLVAGFFAGYVYISMTSYLKLKAPVYITITKNQTVDKILDTLTKNKILTPSWLMKPYFKLYLKIRGKKIYAGSYKFESINTNGDVIRALAHGIQNNMVKVTYPEGITVRDFAKISADRLGISEKEFLRIAYSDSLIKARGIPNNNIDGYLRPATYIFFWEQPPADIIKRLLDEQEEIWDNQFADKAKLLGKSKHTVLTLAAIVEAETPVIEERRTVAGVYSNRLRKGMKLEADPTVQYAIGAKRKLSYDDLTADNKYNTYKFAGLPPGPINNPSKSAIDAALDPESNNYMFFVAVGDGSGRHNFSANFSQHKGFVKEYRNNRKKK